MGYCYQCTGNAAERLLIGIIKHSQQALFPSTTEAYIFCQHGQQERLLQQGKQMQWRPSLTPTAAKAVCLSDSKLTAA